MTLPKAYRYYDLILVAFVTVLLCSNLIGVSKVCTVGGITFGAGTLFFPISYAFGDILTEVYGYARSRRVVWAGFTALVFASVMSWIVLHLPPSPGWPHQQALQAIFGSTPRIVIASLVAYFVGEFMNSFILAKLKVATSGKHLWARTIGSTALGELADSLIFYPLAFIGLWPTAIVIQVMISNYFLKVIWEILATPLTYKIVGYLKRVENEDYYDRNTNFTPFSLN
jgi:uncharacterized integral membrane protein (TIGR00697 family)